MLTDKALILITVDGNDQEITFDALPVYGYDMILGRPWLEKCNPVIDWANDQLNFGTKTDRHESPDCAPGVHGQLEDVPDEDIPKNAEVDEPITTWIRFYETEDPHDSGYESDDDQKVAACYGSPTKTVGRETPSSRRKTARRSGTTPHDDSLGDLSKVLKEYLQYSLFRKKIPLLLDHGPTIMRSSSRKEHS